MCHKLRFFEDILLEDFFFEDIPFGSIYSTDGSSLFLSSLINFNFHKHSSNRLNSQRPSHTTTNNQPTPQPTHTHPPTPSPTCASPSPSWPSSPPPSPPLCQHLNIMLETTPTNLTASASSVIQVRLMTSLTESASSVADPMASA